MWTLNNTGDLLEGHCFCYPRVPGLENPEWSQFPVKHMGVAATPRPMDPAFQLCLLPLWHSFSHCNPSHKHWVGISLLRQVSTSSENSEDTWREAAVLHIRHTVYFLIASLAQHMGLQLFLKSKKKKILLSQKQLSKTVTWIFDLTVLDTYSNSTVLSSWI